VTGGGAALPAELPAYLDGIREIARIPVCAGFGIRGPEQVAELAPHADGVIVGSALVETLEAGQDPAEFLISLRACVG